MFSPCLDPDDSDRSPGAEACLREEPDEPEREEEEGEASTMMRVATMTRMEEAMRYPRAVCVPAER